MIALYIILSIFILLFLAAMLPVSLTLKYKDDVTVCASVLAIKFKLYPKKKKKVKISSYSERKLERKRKKSLINHRKAKSQKKKKTQAAPAKKKTLLESLELIHQLLSTLISGIIKHVKIKTTKIVLNVASDDAAKTALLYAAAKNAVLVILTFLDSCKKLEKFYSSEISVNADFLSEKFSADVEISFSLRIWHLIKILFASALKYVKNKSKIKEGQNNG